MKHQSQAQAELKVQTVDLGLINHLFAFEGCELLDTSIISRLICQGWPPAIFQELLTVNFLPRCDGFPMVFYSRNRDTLLMSVLETDLPTTLEIEKNLTKHFHSMPPSYR